MSPTATLASVVAALMLIAWVFKSDVRDPGYEELLKRQEREQKVASAKPTTGAPVTDSGVVKDDSTVAQRIANKNRLEGSNNSRVTESDAAMTVSFGSGANTGNDQTVLPTGPRETFPNNFKFTGSFVLSTAIESLPVFEQPIICFKSDGSFTSANMGKADVDMEAGVLLGATIDKGAGTYKISRTTLDLTYTDNMKRPKGNQRTYVIIPASIDALSPTCITIQGKIFNLDPTR